MGRHMWNTCMTSKMTKLIRSNVEYNRRAVIIEVCHIRCSLTEIIWFFGYRRSTVYGIMQKYADVKKSEEGSSKMGRLQGPLLSSKEFKSSFQKTEDCLFVNCPPHLDHSALNH